MIQKIQVTRLNQYFPLIFALFPDVDALLIKAPPSCSKHLLFACQSSGESRDWRSGRWERRSECEALCVLKLSFLSLHSNPHQSLDERRGKTINNTMVRSARFEDRPMDARSQESATIGFGTSEETHACNPLLISFKH